MLPARFKAWVAICMLFHFLATLANLHAVRVFSSAPFPDADNIRDGLLAMILVCGFVWCIGAGGLMVVAIRNQQRLRSVRPDPESALPRPPSISLRWWYERMAVHKSWEVVLLGCLSSLVALPIAAGFVIPLCYTWDLLVGQRIAGTLPNLLPGMSSVQLAVALSYMYSALQFFPSTVCTGLMLDRCSQGCPGSVQTAADFAFSMSFLSLLFSIALYVGHALDISGTRLFSFFNAPSVLQA